MAGCVGALDGLLLLIRTPTWKEASIDRQFFSGHYQRMGLNVQGSVDCHLRFINSGIFTGGRSSDYKAYQKSKVRDWIENLTAMNKGGNGLWFGKDKIANSLYSIRIAIGRGTYYFSSMLFIAQLLY
jgi:hypothetical protein